MNLAGHRICQQVGEPFTQEAASAPIQPVGVVFTAAFDAGEDRLDTGTGRADDDVVAQPCQRPHQLATRTGLGVVVPPPATADADASMRESGQAVGACALPAGVSIHPLSPGRRILARIGRRSPIPGPLSLTAGVWRICSWASSSRSLGVHAKMSQRAASRSRLIRCGGLSPPGEPSVGRSPRLARAAARPGRWSRTCHSPPLVGAGSNGLRS